MTGKFVSSMGVMNVSEMTKIQELLLKKRKNREGKHLVMKDVNRELIVSLLAIPVYGKDVRDEEILSVILNASKPRGLADFIERICDDFDRRVEAGEIKRQKGVYRDEDGFMVLQFER